MKDNCATCLGKEFCYGEEQAPNDKTCELYRPEEKFLDEELIGWADDLAKQLYQQMVKEVIKMGNDVLDVGLSFSLDELVVEETPKKKEEEKAKNEDGVKEVTPEEVIQEVVQVEEEVEAAIEKEVEEISKKIEEKKEEIKKLAEMESRRTEEKCSCMRKATTEQDIALINALHKLIGTWDYVRAQLISLGVPKERVKSFGRRMLHVSIDLAFDAIDLVFDAKEGTKDEEA